MRLLLLLIPVGGIGQATSSSDALALLQKGDYLWQQAWPDSALATYEKAYPLARTHAERVAVFHRVGKCYVRRFDFETARPWLDSALLLSDVVGALHPDVMFARAEKANIITFSGAFYEGLGKMRQIVADAGDLPPSADTLRAELIHRLSIYFHFVQDFDSAAYYGQKALDIRKQVY
ncbi:MAG: hypothetical protein AAFV07_05510, partial [Bacteroidota bacterium]